jgi:uncharacterized protein (TIGR03435 family)
LAKGDTKLRHFEERGCTVFDPAKPYDPTKPQPLTPGAKPPCKGVSLSRNERSVTLKAEGVSLDQLWMLGSGLDRPVINKTGITGSYTFQLEFVPENIPSPFGVRGGGDSPAATDPNLGPSISNALDRLGLKLEAGKGPSEQLVVDRVERPVEN